MRSQYKFQTPNGAGYYKVGLTLLNGEYVEKLIEAKSFEDIEAKANAWLHDQLRKGTGE